MKAVWDDQTITDTIETFLLVILADFCNEQLCCWPAVSTIAARARMSIRGTQMAIARLEQKGRIEVVRKPRSTNIYKLTLTPHPMQGNGQFYPAPPAGLAAINPAPDAPHPAPDDIQPRRACAPPPRTSSAGDPSLIPKRSINDPSDPKGKGECGAGYQQNGNGGHDGKVHDYELFKTRIFALYSRPPTECLSFIEESSLCELVRGRVNFKDELEVIQAFKNATDPRYFPQSLLTLVEKWQGTLDRARLKNGDVSDEEVRQKKERLIALGRDPDPAEVERCRLAREARELKVKA